MTTQSTNPTPDVLGENQPTCNQSKQEELRKNIEGIILSWSSEISGEQREKLHPETDQLVLRHIDLINSEVLAALIEIKSNDALLGAFDLSNPAEKAQATIVNNIHIAIDEVERKYRNE